MNINNLQSINFKRVIWSLFFLYFVPSKQNKTNLITKTTTQ